MLLFASSRPPDTTFLPKISSPFLFWGLKGFRHGIWAIYGPYMGHIWSYMDHIWPYMVHIWAIYDHIWSIYDHIWPIYGHIWAIYGHIWSIYGHIWSIYGHIWAIYGPYMAIYENDMQPAQESADGVFQSKVYMQPGQKILGQHVCKQAVFCHQQLAEAYSGAYWG